MAPGSTATQQKSKYRINYYYIETGRNKKASYTIKQSSPNHDFASLYYKGINTGKGYKKRLIYITETGKIHLLAKYQS